MERTWQRLRWESRVVELEEEGAIAVELWAAPLDGGEPSRRGRVIYWDAEGQLFVDLVSGELPLVVLEEAIAQAKTLTHLDRPRRAKLRRIPGE